MVKITNISVKFNNYIKEYNNVFSITDSSFENETLFCNFCKKNINCSKKSNLKQHLDKVLHRESMINKNSNDFETQNDFNQELCDLFVSLNIPLNNINKQNFKNFFLNSNSIQMS